MNFILKLWLYLAFAMVGAIGYYLWEHRDTVTISRLVTGLIFGMTQTHLVMLSCNVMVLLFYRAVC